MRSLCVSVQTQRIVTVGGIILNENGGKCCRDKGALTEGTATLEVPSHLYTLKHMKSQQ